MRRTRFLAATLALFAVAAAPAPVAGSDSASRIRAHVEYLADDHLQGRDTGSVGYALAADYVAGQFRALGLQPGANGSWYQQVPFRHATNARPPTIKLTVGGKTVRLTSGKDFALLPSVSEKSRLIDAPLVFVGHGISEPRLGIDEYAGLDVRGKLAVVLRGAPGGLDQEISAHLDVSKERVAAEQGAVGLIELSFGSFNAAASRAQWPIIDWVDPVGRAGQSGDVRAEMILSPAASRQIFAGAQRSLESVLSSSRSAIPGFALRARMHIEADSAWQDFKAPNVVAVLPGSDPKLGHEHVVLMGHLDHLGVETSAGPHEDAIYNGALDNAAGVATLIEAARSFTASGRRPRRSVMFVATTGEERGLVGADYFAAHPPVARDNLAALVNLDMPLLTYGFTDVIGFGAEHSTIGEAVAEAGRSMGIALTPDPMPEQSLFIRSDHYRFVLRGVPAIFLMTGHANGGKEAWGRYLGRAYHRPNDDLSQAIDWRAGAKFSELNYRIARALADAPQRPRWYRGDYFGDHYAPGQPRAERPAAATKPVQP